MSVIATQVIGAFIWSVVSILISQIVSVTLMAWLGLPPKKLTHEIEVIQNPAIGASFFIVSLTVAFFVNMFTTDVFSRSVTPEEADFLTSTGWIVGALALGTLFMLTNFMIAHRVMGRENNESVFDYIKRELIEEQNVSLAFFLGGLSVVPYISVLFQMV